MNGVALEGGGARGAYHAGAIKALKDRKIMIDAYVGTSIGSINAAIACTGDINKLLKLWKTANCQMLLDLDEEVVKVLQRKNITRANILKTIQQSKKIIKSKGIDTSNIRTFLEENIDEDEIRKSEVDFGLVTFNISDTKPIQIFKEDIPKGKLIEYLMASSYLPVFKSSKIIDDKYYFDGGIYDNLPVDMLIDRGYEKIYAVRTNAIGRVKKIKDKRIVYIKPRKKLGSMLMFDPVNSQRNINLGYFDTLKAIDDLDGYNYYIKPKENSYYNEIMKKITPYDLNRLRLEYRTINNKIIAIKLVEKLAKELKIDEFKIYNFHTLLLKVKVLIDENHKQYKIVRNIKFKFFQS